MYVATRLAFLLFFGVSVASRLRLLELVSGAKLASWRLLNSGEAEGGAGGRYKGKLLTLTFDAPSLGGLDTAGSW